MLQTLPLHLFFFFLFFNITFSFAQSDSVLSQDTTSYWRTHINELNKRTAVCYMEGEYVAAEYLNNIAYQEAKNCLDKPTTEYVVAFYNSGMFLDHHSKHEEAIKVYQQVKDLEEMLQVGNGNLSSSYNAIGWSYQSLGDYHNALNYMDKAIQLRQNSSLRDSVLVAFVSDKALCLEYLGELDNAKEANQDCLKLINDLDNKDTDFVNQVTLYCYQNLASIALQQKENPVLIDRLLKQSEHVIMNYDVSQKQCHTYKLWGDLNIQEKNYKAAQQYYNKALKLLKKELDGRKKDIRLGTLHTQKAIAYQRVGNFEQALKQHQKALNAISIEKEYLTSDDLEKSKNVQFINKLYAIEILAAKAHTLVQMKNLEAADKSYQLAIALIPETRRSYKEVGSKYHLASTTTSIYEAAIEVALQLFEKTKDATYKERAFALSESNKAVVLLEDMQCKIAKNTVSNPRLKDLLHKEEQLRYDMNALERQIVMLKSTPEQDQATQKRIKNLNNKLLDKKEIYDKKLQTALKKYPHYWSSRYDIPPMSVQKVQQEILPNNKTGLLEFFVGDKSIYLFFITSTSFKIEKIEKTKQIEQYIRDFRQVVSQSPKNRNATEIYDLFVESGTCLYETLLASCLKDAANLSSLIIIPDGQLYNIPMDALLRKRPQKEVTYDLENLDYLFEDYAVSYHYSVQLFLFNQTNKSTNSGFVGFAPKELMNAEKEVKAICTLLDGECLIGEKVTFNAFQYYVRTVSILHIATHAKAYEQCPQIFLFEDTLTHYDLENIPFTTDLVVLSACETSYGEIVRGEGAMTLARAIIQGGSSSVLATAWRVNDKATKDLMLHFYKNLKNGWTKDKSLQMSKIQYLQATDKMHPFYWASFQQYGRSEAMYARPKSVFSLNSESKGYSTNSIVVFFIIIGFIYIINKLIIYSFVFFLPKKNTNE